jgi:NNP family nitrate/nitrite transporter-like MFS transporter
MSNITFFFPKRMQGMALGLNAGLGNIGVSVMQVLLPFVMTFPLFGALSGDPQLFPQAFAGHPAGTQSWIQNCGLVWVPILVVLAILAWLFMNNQEQHHSGSTTMALGRMLYLLMLGFAAAAAGAYLLISLKVNMWIVLPITILLTLAFIRYLAPRRIRENMAIQYAIFNRKHNWIMTWLYVMTFGSFIGYSAAFPKLIQDVFGYLPDGTINPNAPAPFAYAWLGPLVGSVVRPVGGWLSDKLGGARVTHWGTVVMILAALGVAYFVKLASNAATPETHFVPFLLLFLLLFITSGIGNGSTFRMIPIIFEPKLAGPVLGWTSAVAAYGAFIVPNVFGAQIQAGHPENAFYGFAVYYVTCLAVNWWFYARKNAEIHC